MGGGISKHRMRYYYRDVVIGYDIYKCDMTSSELDMTEGRWLRFFLSQARSCI